MGSLHRRTIRAIAPRVVVAATQRVASPARQVEPLYTSPAWRSLLARLIAERGRRCEACGRTGSGGAPIRIFGDHVVELRDGGARLDPSNVRLLCGSCHTTKTMRERARRAGRA